MRSEFFILANVNKPQCCTNARQKENSAGESGNSINLLAQRLPPMTGSFFGTIM